MDRVRTRRTNNCGVLWSRSDGCIPIPVLQWLWLQPRSRSLLNWPVFARSPAAARLPPSGAPTSFGTASSQGSPESQIVCFYTVVFRRSGDTVRGHTGKRSRLHRILLPYRLDRSIRRPPVLRICMEGVHTWSARLLASWFLL